MINDIASSVRTLPEKWRTESRTSYSDPRANALEQCADELACAIKDVSEENKFELTIDECKALYFFLNVHGALLKEYPEQYTHILRLINGLPQFIDSYEKT